MGQKHFKLAKKNHYSSKPVSFKKCLEIDEMAFFINGMAYNLLAVSHYLHNLRSRKMYT